MTSNNKIGHEGSRQLSIAICICTYKRPQGLKNVLDSLQNLVLDQGSFAVFVADNDSVSHAGYDFIEKEQGAYRFEISCEIEEKPGISHARNRALRMVKNASDYFSYIAFTDDDVEVSRHWLQDLVTTAMLYQADIVVGKREAKFAVPPPRDILQSGFFDDETACRTTGTLISDGNTSNVLFKKEIFDKEGYEPFDAKLALAGGEDCDLFMRLYRKNYKMVQCASAVIYEIYPAERLNEQWITTRYYRSGSTYAYILYKYGSRKDFYVRAMKKVAVFLKDAISYLLNPSLKRKCKLNNTLGFFFFFFKRIPYEEYKHSSSLKSLAN